MSRTTEKKRGMPKGKRLNPSIIAKGFKLYCENKSMNAISRELGIAASTVRRYRDSDNWESRRADVQQKAAQKVDAQAVNEQSRQLTLARFMQTKGINRMRTLQDKDISAKDSIAMVKEGILLERAIMGEGEKTIEIKIKLPAGLEDL